jgi:hypothetical protein
MTALERQCADDPRAVFPRMSPAQERGEECVVCWRQNPEVPIPHMGGLVRACGRPRTCAWQLGFNPDDGWQEARS